MHSDTGMIRLKPYALDCDLLEVKSHAIVDGVCKHWAEILCIGQRKWCARNQIEILRHTRRGETSVATASHRAEQFHLRQEA